MTPKIQSFPKPSMPRTTAPSTNPRILSGYAPYGNQRSDEVSVSKGSPSTTEGRRQLLLDDPYARDVEPEQVTCTRCSKTVRLQKGKQYHLAHWLDHRWKCDRAVVSPQPRAKCHTLAERKAILEADPDTKVVEPERVVCSKCDKEVKLRKGRPYGLSSWNQHKLSCQTSIQSPAPSSSGSVSPSPSYTEARFAIERDSLVAAVDYQRIKCALCFSWIDVEGEGELELQSWRKHRNSCVAENFAGAKGGSSRPRFFRPQHHFPVLNSRASGSPETHEPPRFRQASWSRTADPHQHNSSYLWKARTTDVESEPSLSRSASPPPLSFSTDTSAATSAASTPMTSPGRRTSSVSNSRENTPLMSLSRLVLNHDKQGRIEPRGGSGALGLQISPTRPPSPSSESSPSPPPYLERTSLILPLPQRYWRFDA